MGRLFNSFFRRTQNSWETMRPILIVCLFFLSFVDIKIKVNGSREIENVDQNAEALDATEDGEIHLHFHLNKTSEATEKGKGKGKDYQYITQNIYYPDYPVYTRRPQGRNKRISRIYDNVPRTAKMGGDDRWQMPSGRGSRPYYNNPSRRSRNRRNPVSNSKHWG